MSGLDESRLDSALRNGLKGIEGLPESARFADEKITKYLKQKLEMVLLREYRRRSFGNEDEKAVAERATQILDEVVLDAQKMYRLFQLHMSNKPDEFWEGLSPEGIRGGAALDPGKAAFNSSYSTGVRRASTGERRFHCLEGCDFVGELAYLSHRDQGHHPVPG